ncbi:MAG: 2,3-dihydroxybenzoate-AMP ligase [Deltaproteobacteria bacterium RIFCSPLOWO2_12_FULL_60_19]|nr:MAG: 2,3-dihydroxybenzoate-AMP ligase [Deltaproteobacteria bacterium RIFCSPLOWO2_12_FULL_60_19]
MLDGVVRFPPEFAARYRAKGYWEDRSLADTFSEVFAKYADRVAIIDRDRHITYAEIDERSTRLALNLLDEGIKPLDRVVMQLPNVVEFVYLYFALQKIGCIPILALPTHRFREVSQFVELSGAVACAAPDRAKEFDYREMIRRIRDTSKTLRWGMILGDAPPGFLSLTDLIERQTKRSPGELKKIIIDPEDPALFQLSGGTTGISKLIPRTHNDYVYNSKLAASVTAVGAAKVLLDVLPLAHNLPLACPGLQGFLLHGGKVVLATTTRGEDIFRLIERHRVTHVHVVPALLIRWLNDPLIKGFDLSSLQVIQSGGQRLQPEVRRRAEELIPSVTVQENFGMAEGMLMFVRLDDPEEVRMEMVGRPISPDDEVRLVDEDDHEVAPGEVGEFLARGPYTLRGYYGVPEYNAKAFTRDGFYRSGDLMRRHPSGNYLVAGRKKDLINRGGEKISAEEIENLILTHPAVQNVACVPMPDPLLGERMCACVVLRRGGVLTLKELVAFLANEEIARHKLPERLEIVDDFPLSPFGKVSKKELTETITMKLKEEEKL